MNPPLPETTDQPASMGILETAPEERQLESRMSAFPGHVTSPQVPAPAVRLVCFEF